MRSIGEIIDAPIEVCVDHFNKMSKGELTSVGKLLQITYEQVNMVKEGLLTMLQVGKKNDKILTTEDRTEIQGSIQDLYKTLQRIEDRFNVTQEILKTR